ncbi:MAG: hypothetical protein AVDCRST_MAG04-2829, partial [uncultured Acetobacteraceae bacterium]
ERAHHPPFRRGPHRPDPVPVLRGNHHAQPAARRQRGVFLHGGARFADGQGRGVALARGRPRLRASRRWRRRATRGAAAGQGAVRHGHRNGGLRPAPAAAGRQGFL